MGFNTKEYPYAVVEYISFPEPLVEAVPSSWLYEGQQKSVDGQKVLFASSYWPKQASKVEHFIRSNRNPGGSHGIIADDVWSKGHRVKILVFCISYSIACLKRNKAVHTDHLDTTDVEADGLGRRYQKRKRSHVASAEDSDSDECAPRLKTLNVQKVNTNSKNKKIRRNQIQSDDESCVDPSPRRRNSSKDSDCNVIDRNDDDADSVHNLSGDNCGSPGFLPITPVAVYSPSSGGNSIDGDHRTSGQPLGKRSLLSSSHTYDKTDNTRTKRSSGDQTSHYVVTPVKDCQDVSVSSARHSAIVTMLSAGGESSAKKSPKRKLFSSKKSPLKFLAGQSSSIMGLAREVAEMKGMMNKVIILLNKVWTAVAPPMEGPASSDKFPQLPIQSKADLQRWHNFISDDRNFYSAVNVLASHGVPNHRMSVYAMLRTLLTDDLASGFNVDGRNKKKEDQKEAFGSTLSYKLVKVSMKKHINQFNQGIDPKKVSLVYSVEKLKEDTMRWLKDAKARASNKAKREAKEAASAADQDDQEDLNFDDYFNDN